MYTALNANYVCYEQHLSLLWMIHKYSNSNFKLELLPTFEIRHLAKINQIVAYFDEDKITFCHVARKNSIGAPKGMEAELITVQTICFFLTISIQQRFYFFSKFSHEICVVFNIKQFKVLLCLAATDQKYLHCLFQEDNSKHYIVSPFQMTPTSASQLIWKSSNRE